MVGDRPVVKFLELVARQTPFREVPGPFEGQGRLFDAQFGGGDRTERRRVVRAHAVQVDAQYQCNLGVSRMGWWVAFAHGGQPVVRPPSTGITVPWMRRASSEARKAMTSAISDGPAMPRKPM